MLVGRLCAVLAREDAVRLLTAYLGDILADVSDEEQSVETETKRSAVKAELVVHYPPRAVTGAD